jgi:signal transduction histidine kinase
MTGTSEGVSPLEQELALLRKTVGRVQHEINNPLAALLAETQLLAMEPQLSEEHRVAAKRLEDLVRRVIAAVRKLDEVRGEPTL